MSFKIQIGEEWWVHYCGACGTSNILLIADKTRCMGCDGFGKRVKA